MNLHRLVTVITAVALATAFDLLSITKPASAVGLTGLTDDNTLVNFDSNNPTITSSVVPITGLGSANLIGIDYRPANGVLYGVTDTNSIYTINPGSGATTFVSNLSAAFTGDVTSGIDFNPVVNRLRLVGSNDQNFRINVDTGETNVDTQLAYTDAGPNPRITAEAYTNSFPGSSSTELFGIDFGRDVLVLQSPPNAGTLTVRGSLGIDFDPTGGFDIFTDANGVNTAFAASDSILYTINLLTGAATPIDEIGAGDSLVGLAVEPVPEPSSVLGMLTFGAIGTFSLLKRNQKKNVKAY